MLCLKYYIKNLSVAREVFAEQRYLCSRFAYVISIKIDIFYVSVP
jgi:hypothetical protein